MALLPLDFTHASTLMCTLTNRRIHCRQQEEIFQAMEAIEILNPTPSPADSALLGGKWSLLYTGASAQDAALRRAKEVRLLGACG